MALAPGPGIKLDAAAFQVLPGWPVTGGSRALRASLCDMGAMRQVRPLLRLAAAPKLRTGRP